MFLLERAFRYGSFNNRAISARGTPLLKLVKASFVRASFSALLSGPNTPRSKGWRRWVRLGGRTKTSILCRIPIFANSDDKWVDDPSTRSRCRLCGGMCLTKCSNQATHFSLFIHPFSVTQPNHSRRSTVQQVAHHPGPFEDGHWWYCQSTWAASNNQCDMISCDDTLVVEDTKCFVDEHCSSMLWFTIDMFHKWTYPFSSISFSMSVK